MGTTWVAGDMKLNPAINLLSKVSHPNHVCRAAGVIKLRWKCTRSEAQNCTFWYKSEKSGIQWYETWGSFSSPIAHRNTVVITGGKSAAKNAEECIFLMQVRRRVGSTSRCDFCWLLSTTISCAPLFRVEEEQKAVCEISGRVRKL